MGQRERLGDGRNTLGRRRKRYGNAREKRDCCHPQEIQRRGESFVYNMNTKSYRYTRTRTLTHTHARFISVSVKASDLEYNGPKNAERLHKTQSTRIFLT